MCVGQDSEGVNGVVKYLLFFFNFIFWLIGCALIGLGAWAYIEKNRFYHNDIQSIYDILFDVSIGIIVVGCIIFVIAFAGCLGALRENITLLKTFSYMLGILFLLEVVGAILIFVFSGQGREEVTKLFREEGIIRYRDDPDFQSIFDWVQETFYCCGVGHKGYKEWSMNVYFNCSDTNPSAEKCAVPFSCCRQPNDVSSGHKNLMCGYGVQKLDYLEATEKVYIKGCVQAVIDEAKQNLYILGAVALALAVPQILGSIVACWFAIDIQDRHEDMMKTNYIRHVQNGVNVKKRNTIRSAQNRPNSYPDASALVEIDYGYDLYANLGNNSSAAGRTTKRHLSQPPILARSVVVPRRMELMPEKEPLRTELIPIMKHHEPKKKHLNPLGLPPIVGLASHSVRNRGVTRLERSTSKVHKNRPRRRILNPLNLPPIARAAGLNVVVGILARREKMMKRTHKQVSIVTDDHRDQQTLGSDHLQPLDHHPQTPRSSHEQDIDAIEKPPKKTRIYPQHQLRDLCSASDIVNMNMSVLSSPTVQSTPKSNIAEAMASRHTYPHLPQPVSTQAQGHNMARAEVHASSDHIDAPHPGPSTSSGEPKEPTTFAQMQEILKELLSPERQPTRPLDWELPATTGNNIREPLLIPRPDYNTVDPPAQNCYPHMASYLPQLPQVHHQHHLAQPYNNYAYSQYQPPPTISVVPSIAHPGSMSRSVQYASLAFPQPMPRAAQPVSVHAIPGTSYVRYPQEVARPGRPFHNFAYRGHSRVPRYRSEGPSRISYY